uniref:Uncharacterized protein n=1 Tax=viral metagenome TaxID=1070528 RepID=A0A6C0LEU5_9ZZZZ
MIANGFIFVVAGFIACFFVEKTVPIKPTTHFLNTSEYLPILTANIFADLVVIFLNFNKIAFNNEKLTGWYKKYRLAAMIADILIGVIYMLIARYMIYIFKWNIGLTGYAALAVAVQMILDYVFYLFFSAVPKGANNMLDYFKEYAKSAQLGAIFGDSILVIIAVILSAIFNAHGFDFNIIMLILSVYLAPFLIYTKD